VTTRTLCRLQHPVPAQGRLRRILYPTEPEIVIRPSVTPTEARVVRPPGTRSILYGRGTTRRSAPSYSRLRHAKIRPDDTVGSRADSDLEAFSRNPSDDGFASLSVRINAIPNIRINGSSRTESNYCLDGTTLVLRSSVG
jgi:hypothetical protein